MGDDLDGSNVNRSYSLAATSIAIFTFMLFFLYPRFRSGEVHPVLFQVTLGVMAVATFSFVFASLYYYGASSGTRMDDAERAKYSRRGDRFWLVGYTLLFLDPSLILFSIGLAVVGLVWLGLWAVYAVFVIRYFPKVQRGGRHLTAALLLTVGPSGHGTAQENDPSPPPIDVLIIGTYHFDNPGRDLVNPQVSDVLAPGKQAEIAQVIDALARFRPTKIAVEAQPGSAARLDSLYRGALAGTRPFGRNEVEQLGLRLAQRLRHARVYPIDAPGEFPIEPVFAYAERYDTAGLRRIRGVLAQVEAEHDSLQRTATVRQILRFENDPARLAWSHGFYLELARIGGADSLVGATLLAAWYERNVRIFVNLLRVAKPGDRILVLFGAGHAPTLRELVEAAPGFRLVEARDFL